MDKILYIIKKYIPVKLFKALQPAYHFIFSWISAAVYRWPSEKLIVIGVTGTTGKTTSVYLIAKMLTAVGYKVGYTSTAMFGDGKKEWLNNKKMTMPGRFFTQKILRDMAKNGCQYALVETTSEGIRQFRHRFINYDTLIFTGLYPEHIESHGSFANYKKAKGELFKHLKRCGVKYANNDKCICPSDSGFKKIELNRVKKTIIANGDDEEAGYFLSFWAEEKKAYTRNNNFKKDGVEAIKYSSIKSGGEGTSFSVVGEKINLKILGEFNVANAMTAVSVGLAERIDIKKIKIGLEKINGVPGRLERINEGQKFTVLVDYAFEPKAVSKLYEAIKLISKDEKQKKNIIHVLGSTGGGRDKARRPHLGKIAGAKADYVIITNEDPYDDDPQEIINQVAEGAIEVGKKEGEDLFKILDRREAIHKALALAKENDIVLITGKGSEQAICVAEGEKIPWDDREVTKEELKKI
ncbi:MAG: UDP-N-acetylmuramyl-tripeptide synthetase [Patescibacteria group bacterium]